MKLVAAPFYNALCYFILKKGDRLPDPDTGIKPSSSMASNINGMATWSNTPDGGDYWHYIEEFFYDKFGSYNFAKVQEEYLKEIAKFDK